jgi:hypothetical protein
LFSALSRKPFCRIFSKATCAETASICRLFISSNQLQSCIIPISFSK